MKFLLSFLIFLVFSLPSIQSQPLKINWQQCIGDTGSEGGKRVIKVNTGFYLFGTTNSNSGLMTDNHGLNDYWVIRTDTSGNVLWSKTYGGSDDEALAQAQQTYDGGFVLFGETWSNNSQVSGNHGMSDYWVIKIDSLGNLLWQKCFGGSYIERASDMVVTSDSGFLCIGSALSDDGDVTGNHGYYDYWVVKLDKNGDLKWENSYGSSHPDAGIGITSTNDGGAILVGIGSYSDSDIQCNYHGGNQDAWIVKIDSTGAIQWQQCYGGSGDDAMFKVLPLAGGGFLCAGKTGSNDGQVLGNHGSYDIWVIIIDQFGNLIKQKCFGGTRDEFCQSLESTSDGNFLLGSYTYSNNGDVTGNHSYYADTDMWLIKISPDLDLIWQECLGGFEDEQCFDALDLGFGNYIVTGFSNTNDNTGNVNCQNKGYEDLWLVSLIDTTYTGINQIHINKSVIRIFPNPANKEVTFEYEVPAFNYNTRLAIYNELGIIIKEYSLKELTGKITWNSEQVSSGLYFYRFINGDKIITGKFCIVH